MNNENNNLNNNLDNTLNIKPDVDIMNALNNGQMQNNQAPVNNEVPINNIPLENPEPVNNTAPVNPVDNNMVNTSVNNEVPVNNIPVNNPEPFNNTTPINPVPVNNDIPVNNPTFNNPEPVNNVPVQNNTNKSGGSNTVLFIILGIFIFLIIAVLSCVLIIKLVKPSVTDRTTVRRTTEYITTTTRTTTKNYTDETFDYKGITFNKESGYIYEEDLVEGALKVYNTSYVMYIAPVNKSFSVVKNTDFTSSLNSSGKFTVSNRKIDTYDGIEMSTYEVTDKSEVNKAILAYTEYPGYDFTMVATVENNNSTINYEDLKVLSKIIKNSIFSGDYTKFKKDLN